MNLKKPGAVIAAILSLTISGCATTCEPIVVKPVPLPLPMQPKLPTINANELACLSDGTYAALVAKDVMRKNYGDECLAIIKSTH